MGVAEVRRHFKSIAPDIEIFEFEQSSATVDLAAEALAIDPDKIAKTMAFHLKDEDILIVLAGKAKINNRKFKDVFNQKAKMIKPDNLIEITGHPMGGVCPFGLPQNLTIYLDESLKKHEIVYPAAGAPNAAVKMELEKLERITQGTWIDVSDHE